MFQIARSPRLLASAACIILVSALWFGSATAGTRLPETVRPTFQQIELTLDPALRDYSGEVHVDLAAAGPLRSIVFHAQGLELDSVQLFDSKGVVASTHRPLDSARVTIEPARELPPGTYRLDVSFHNTFDTQAVSLYRVETEGRSYLFSQMEEDEARKAFPCWDEPGFKFPYQVIMNVPDSLTAITNTPIDSESARNGWKRVVFARSRPMPSYLLAFAVGPFDTVAIPGLSIPGRVVTVRGKGGLATEAVRSTPPILAALERYFGAGYPFRKLDLIAAPEFWPGAMENPGAIVFAERGLLPDLKTITARQKRGLASTTAHELAHMWFGDLVTMAWWDDLWLNESFASWMGNKIVQEVFPEYEADVASVQRVQQVLNADALPSAKAVHQPVNETSDLLANIGVIYGKGQAVLSMFEQWIGKERFRAGVLAYLKEHAWGNATASDLWAALGEASGQDVGRAMSTFIDQPGAPLVDVVPLQPGKILFRQRRLANFGVEPLPFRPWFIPITVTYRAGSRIEHQTFELTDTAATFDLVTDSPLVYILPNSEARGYYRWTVPSDLLRVLADNNMQIMRPRERIGFLGNLAALLDAGAVTGDTYLDAIQRSGTDLNAHVLTAVISALADVESAFITDDLRPAFARYVQDALGPALRHVGMRSIPGEEESVTLLRPRLLSWLADQGRDPDVRSYAADLFRRYLSEPDSVDPELIGLAIQEGCRHGDRELFEACRHRFETASVPAERSRFLEALGCFEDPALQDEALGYSLSESIRPQEVLDIPQVIAERSDRDADRVYRWIEANYAAIAGKIPPVYRTYLPFFAGGCSRARLKAAEAFFGQAEHQAPGMDIRMARLRDGVEACATLREREGDRVAAYLGRFSDGAAPAATPAR